MSRDPDPTPASPRPRRRYDATKTLHSPRPDYTRPGLVIPPETRDRLLGRLRRLYGATTAREWLPELERVCRVYHAHKPPEMLEREAHLDPLERFTEEDAVLITYGDLIREDGRSPLATLARFCGLQLRGAINTLHILPFFPYSSDRGFAVIDFETVDPRLGTWQDVEDIETRYQLMFDGVINHVSTQNRWFQEFLDGHPEFQDFFISFGAPEELTPEERSLIFRPRTSDILTAYPTIAGTRHVWTTFSEDQVDLNYENPRVLMRVLEILLLYVRRGADIIRLDAVTYLWARPGTSCVHLEETHEIVRLFRDVLEAVAPHVALITETNVPHQENVSYFGTGADEAHMVYNFALPPLVLHTFYTGSAGVLSRWASRLETPSPTVAFFNFLDSHDGVGLLAARGILSPGEEQDLVRRAREHGGLISHRTEPDGSQTPYEINITWFSALNRGDGGEPLELQVRRFLASRAVALVLRGIPGIYLHSLFGTRNDRDAVLRSEVNRDINRTVVDYEALLTALSDPTTAISQIVGGFTRLLAVRTQERSFHPRGEQRVLDLSPGLFAVQRFSPEGEETVLTLANVRDTECGAEIPLELLGGAWRRWRDLLGGGETRARGETLSVSLPPYGLSWLKPS